MGVQGKRPYTITEGRLLAEYMALRPNTETYEIRVRLGDIDEAHKIMLGTEKARAIFKPTLQWVDAIAWYKGTPTLVECKDWARQANPLYQLQTYRELFKQTPKYAQYWSLTPNLELVSALYSPHIPPLALKLNIRCFLYRPEWILVRLKEKYQVTGYAPVTTIQEVV